jgi:sugar lactone lactonase YvrE
LRRMRAVAVAAVMGAAALAYSLPRVRAQNSPTSNPVGAGAMVAAGADATSASNAPIVIAQGISARGLALGSAADLAPASSEASQLPPIYFTATQMPNRLMALPASGSVSANAAAVAGTAAANANLIAVAGNGAAGSLGDGGAATAAQLSLKLDSQYMRSGVAVAADGTIFIADTKNATIRRISSAASSEPGVIRSVAGKWGPTQNVQLVEPMGLALDRAGNLYIADHGANAVIELHDASADTPGQLEIVAHAAYPTSIAITPDGSRVFTAAPQVNSVFGFNIHAGSASSAAYSLYGFVQKKSNPNLSACTAISGAGAEQHGCPAGVAIDGAGNLFVSDPIGNQIIRLDNDLKKITLVTQGVSAPGEIQFDANGNLFIAEQGRNRISEIKGLGQQVANVMVTLPPPPVPPMGVPCPTIVPPPTFASNTNFCAEPLAGTTPTSAFTLTNNSNAEITGIAISTIGLAPTDFVVSSTSCTTTLNAGSSCLINVGFAPTATGPRTATLVVTYTGATNPLVSSLAGTGDDYQLAFASGQLTEISVAAGNTGTFMLQVVPDNTFTGTVTFICPGNLPAQTTCTFSPASVNITTPGTAVPFSVAFMTTSRVPVPPPKTGARPIVASGNGANGPGGRGVNSNSRGAILALILLIAIVVFCFELFSSTGIPARAASGHMRSLEKRGNKRTRWLVLQVWRERRRVSTFAQAEMPVLPKRLVPIACAIALALSVAAILEGCSGGNGSGGGVTGTPAGSYKMTVQATAQAAPRGVTVTLDVQ